MASAALGRWAILLCSAAPGPAVPATTARLLSTRRTNLPKDFQRFFAGHDDHAWFARGRLRRLFQSMVAPRALSGPCPPSESLCDDRKAGGFTHKDPATQRLSHEGTLHSLLLCAHATTAGSCLCSGASCPSASSDSTISCCPTSTCRPASVRTGCL